MIYNKTMISKLYSQSDSRWAKQLLGYNNDPTFNIGRFGCVVTAYANMLCAITGDMKYTPEYINDYMKSHNGFMPEGGLFIWSVALSMGHVELNGTTSDLSTVNRWLQDPPNFAILEVRAKGSTQHFVMAPYVDRIVDSADGLLKGMGAYPFINAHLYRSTDPIGQPVPGVITPAPTPQPQPSKSGIITVTGQPFLNLRARPSDQGMIGRGRDDSGKIIYSIPFGAVVGYVNVVPADGDSKEQGPWLVSDRGNYFAAKYTTYNG